MISLYQEKKSLYLKIEETKACNHKLKQQIEDLKSDSQAIERIAREELGMVLPEEIVYRFVPPAMAKDKGD